MQSAMNIVLTDRNTPPVVTAVLRLRTSTSTRVALSRALSPSTHDYAYPLVARWRTERNETAILAFAGLAGEYYNVGDDARGASLGSATRALVDRQALSSDRVDTRLAAAQRQQLPQLLPTLRYIFAAAHTAQLSVSWASIYSLLLHWDDPDPAVRLRTRRKLLDDYYKPPAVTRSPGTARSAAVTTTTNPEGAPS